ncbi:MAG: Arm DNA-binding domain-containing protein [Beijerinckiaceae bacterium]|nr:Arm DNA-binding domain-containing protein [Beijerinckiaceae bacterium]MCI0599562.1 Arm DNA-binding domain-containing protein [Beijerinckiaceae bacterium]
MRDVAGLTKPGRHADGGDHYLMIDKQGSKLWTFMFARDGRRHEASLGPLRSVSLAKERSRAAEFWALLAAQIDSLEARRNASKAKTPLGEVAASLSKGQPPADGTQST